ncbi:MAG: hypothetical protein GY755_24455 [Chloroflexi bacterium]|nr:hypothetical protein [Chloroflexota bacterium]
MNYWLSCILLTIPPLVFNIIFADNLPNAFSSDIFDKDIPALIAFPEIILRAFVFIFPLFMPLKLKTKREKTGLIFYLLGISLYFLSWILLISSPESLWSTSIFGFLAPSYTPLIWLFGIALIGDSLYFPIAYKWWYYLLGILAFLIFHISHTFLVYSRGI